MSIRTRCSSAALSLAACASLLGCGGGAVAKTEHAPAASPGYAVLPDALTVEDLGEAYAPNPARVPEALSFAGPPDMGGSTSVRRLRGEDMKFKRQGYFVRNRELGQVFTVPRDVPAGARVDAIVLRTGNSASAVRASTAGAPLRVHWFEVSGEPRIDDNGTPVGATATHGYFANHRGDDFVAGVTYRPLLSAGGGAFPASIPPTDDDGDQPGHLRYLRFDLGGAAEIALEPGGTYAFLVGFAAPGPARGFTLANSNLAGEAGAPAFLRDAAGGERWGIRREGDGTTPPTMRPGEAPTAGTALGDSLRAQSLHPADYLTSVPPTSDGYPDVDTYRALEFYVEIAVE